MASLRSSLPFCILGLLTVACATAGTGTGSDIDDEASTMNGTGGVPVLSTTTTGAGVGGATSTSSSADSSSADSSSADSSSADSSGATSSSGATATSSSASSGPSSSSAATSGSGGGLPGMCGDGILDAGEECDAGKSNSDVGACTSKCKKASCGDKLVQQGVEQCDDGKSNSDVGACTSKCKKAICGDKLVQQGVEQCDDGNKLDGDGCSATCMLGTGVVWTKTYDSSEDFWTGTAVDPSGNVVVVGASTNLFGDFDIVVRKYNSGGAILWTRTYDGGSNDVANGVAIDALGNVFVVGSEEDLLGLTSIWLRKYDPNGNVLFTQNYLVGMDGNDVGFGVATDAVGNAYFAAEVRADFGLDADSGIAKIDGSNGMVLWDDVVSGAFGGDDSGNAVSVDAAGNLLAVSAIAVSAGVSDAVPLAVDTDSKGAVLVAGGDRAGAADYDVWVQKYDAHGNLLWTKNYGNAANLTDAAFSVAVDSKDSVVVAGYETKTAGNTDIWVRKYAATGEITWTQTHGGAANDRDEAYGVTIDGTGHVYVAGVQTSTLFGADGWLRKYLP